MTARLRAADVMDRLPSDGSRISVRQTLDEAAELVRREARFRFGGLVANRLNPGSRFRNRECLPVDHHLFEEASDIGLLQFALPTEIGGAGRDRFDWGVVIAELARISRDPAFPVLLDITVENTELILSSGRPELIERYVPDLVAGRRFAVQAAYESRDPYDYETVARLERGEWILNGAKRFVAGAVFADLFVVYVRDEASNDMLAFLVERDDPGLAPVRLETMGLRSMGLGQLILHDVRLPESRLIWRSDALSELNTYARGRRMMTACGVVGAMEGIVEACVEALATRKRSGRRVLEYPNVERSVGEMRVIVEATRAVVHRALDDTRRPERDAYFDELATTAKHQVCEAALRVGQLVMNLQGGEGYMSAFPWEGFMRDVLGLIGGQGSQELLLIQLGQRSVVSLEGRKLREDGAHRIVEKLGDAWWALSALDYRPAGASDGSALADAVSDVLTAAGLDGPLDATDACRLTELLDASHRLITAMQSGQSPETLPRGLSPEFDGRLGVLASKARAFVLCAAAIFTDVLSQLVMPLSVPEVAARAGVPERFAGELLAGLVDEHVVRVLDDGRYVANPGLEPLLVDGPRGAAYRARLKRAITGSAQLRGSVVRPGVRSAVAGGLPGHGDDAPVLVDVLVNSLLGRLEGLEELLDEPGTRIGCAARDEGRSASMLAGHIPITSVLTLEADAQAAERVLSALPPGARPVDVRAGDITGFGPSDALSMAWLPVAGHSLPKLSRAIDATAQALLAGGWLVLSCPLPPQRRIGAAVARLESALCGAQLPADGEIEEWMRCAGYSHVRTLWDDAGMGIRLLAGRRAR